MKRFLATLLTLVMAFSMVVPANAAAVETPGYKIELKGVTTGMTAGTNSAVNLEVQLHITAATAKALQTFTIVFDSSKLSLVSMSKGSEKSITNASLTSIANMGPNTGTFGNQAGGTLQVFGATLDGDMRMLRVELNLGTDSWEDALAAGTYGTLMNFGFKFKGITASDIDSNVLRVAKAEEAGGKNSLDVAKITNADGTIYKYGSSVSNEGVITPATDTDTLAKPVFTIDGNPIPAASVALTDITVSLNKTTVAVPEAGKTDTTVTATAAAVPSDATLPADVKFSIDPAYAGVAVNASTGVVTVSPSAAAGKVTIKATSDSKSVDGTANLTLTKATPAAKTLTVSATDKTAVYGTAKDITPTFAVKDQYGAAMTGQTITMDAATGFSFDGTKVTVANNATVGNHELTFKCGTASAKLTITVGKANGPAAPSITGENATVKNGNGKLKGTTADMEYSSNNGTSWTTCSATETSVPAGTYIVRVKETATHKAGAATAAITITAPGTSATPTVKVTPAGPIELPEGGSQKLTAAVSGANVNAADCTYVWKKDGTPVAGQTTNELTVTEAGTYTCVVTHTQGSDDPAEGTSNAVVVTVKGKTVVTVAKKATASQNEGALNLQGLVTVTGGTWNQVSSAVTAKVYKFVPADDTADPAVAAHYEEVKEPSLKEGTYYVDVDIAAKDEADYKVTANAGAGAPTDPIDESKYVKLTVNKRSSGGGGGSSTTKYTVTYDAGEHGKLDGSATERVESGKNPAKVPSVVADKGYKFVGWTLNGKSVKPASTKITAATKFVAEYEAADKVTYIQGMDKNHFQPAGNATRGQLATMLARLSKDYDASKTYTGKAPDVENGKWYSNTVNFAINQGIMNGFEDGMFRPTENIRRGEFAAMLARYLGLNTSSKAHFADVTDHWAAGYINALADAGIVDGFEDGTFKAQNLLTRAEAVKMINLAVEMKYDEKADYDNSFVDVAKGAWYYEFVMPAANLDVTDYQR